VVCENTPPISAAPAEVLCDKPHSGLLECACIMGLFVITAYILQKIMPPLPTEQKKPMTESSKCPIIEAVPVQTIAPIEIITKVETVEPNELIAASVNTLEGIEAQDEVRAMQELDTIEAIEAHMSEQPQFDFPD
jgi:hypothetical protein